MGRYCNIKHEIVILFWGMLIVISIGHRDTLKEKAFKKCNINQIVIEAKHGSSEVEWRIVTRGPRVQTSPILGPKRIVFLSVTCIDGYVMSNK